jgi:hypothetical protein
MVCVESYYVAHSQGQPSKHTQELHRFTTPFLSETRVVEGLPYGTRVILSVPPDALPTVKGDAAEIVWRVRAAIDVAGARDVRRSHDIMVFSRTPEHSAPGVAEETFDHCTLALSLSSTTVKEGETLAGDFQVQLRQNLSVQGIRVELECQEKAKDKVLWTVKDLVLLKNQGMLAAGQILEWPIRLHVPIHRLPSTEVHHTLVVWRVKGILDRKARMDLDLEQQITVYTVP